MNENTARTNYETIGEPKKTVGWLSGFPEERANEQTRLAGWYGHEVEEWYADGPDEDYSELRRLITDMRRGVIDTVVHRGPEFMPNDIDLLSEFFSAARETNTTVFAVEQEVPRPLDVLAAKLMPLLHEWNNNETADLAARGHHTIYASTSDVLGLRKLLRVAEASGSEVATRWLERLLPTVWLDGEERL